MKKTTLLKTLLMAVGLLVGTSVWSATEKATKQGTNNTAISGTCYSIAGDFVAGSGNNMKGNMLNEGVKFRTNQASNTLVFTINTGYYITDFKFYCVENGTNGDEVINGVYIDDDTSTNKLASTIDVPKSDGSTSADINISGITAAKKITIQFNNKSRQINGYYELTYQAQTKLSAPTITYDNKTVTIGAVANATKITYTTDGTDPTASSTTYTAPFEVSYKATVKAIAIANGTTHINSDVASQFIPQFNEWDFTDSDIWGSKTLPTAESNTKNYQYNGVEGTTGNYVTFYSSDGTGLRHPSTLTNGIGFSAVGSTSNHYVKLSVPAGSTAIVTANCTSNRRVKVYFNGAESEAFTGDYSDVTKEFANNTEGAIDLYVYCFQNADGNTKQPYLKKIVLKQTVPVTLNYYDKDDLEHTLISPSVVNVEVGSSYTPTYSSPLYVSDSDPYEYTYYSGATERTITEATSIDILYTKTDRAQYSYTLNAIKSDASLLEKIAEGTAYKNANVTIPYSTYILSDGKLYSASAIDDNARKYSKTFVVSSDNQVENITYTENKTGVVFYAEGEEVEGTTSSTASNADVRASNCSAGYNGTAGDLTVCTLTESGNYRITISTYGTKGSYTFRFKAEDKAVVTAAYPGTNGATYSGEFIITGSTNIYWPSTDANHAIDYIYIQRIGDAVVPVTVSDAGYATYVNSDYDLDFSDPALKVKAYTVEVASKGVATLHAINKVPAKTPVLLIGATEDVPVAASTDDVPTNHLVAGTGAAVATDGGTVDDVAYTNMILNNVNSKIGFYFANGQTVAANRAYLHIATTLAPDAESNSRMVMVFADEEATAVFDLNDNSEMTNDNWYDLQGRRVVQPTKGLYIVNGRKVVVK